MATSSNPSALGGVRILVVEDELLLALELRRLLTREGCVVLGPARTPIQALALLADNNPDVVILDLNLGGQSALPVATTLVTQKVPFVIVSAYSRAPLEDPALQQAPYLDKPVNHRALLSTLTRLLQGD